MTRFGPSIEPITFPMLSRYATCYATDAGIGTNCIENKLLTTDKLKLVHIQVQSSFAKQNDKIRKVSLFIKIFNKYMKKHLIFLLKRIASNRQDFFCWSVILSALREHKNLYNLQKLLLLCVCVCSCMCVCAYVSVCMCVGVYG